MNYINLSSNQISSFHNLGYILITDNYFSQMKIKIEVQLKELSLGLIKSNPNFSHLYKQLQNLTLSEIIIFCLKEEINSEVKISPIFYDFFPKSFILLKSLADEQLISILKQLGLEIPTPSTIPVTRIDRPKDNHFLTPLHQDYWYTLNSENSVTVWFPIYECLKSMGYLKIIPKSHKLGLIPFKEFKEYEPFTTIENFENQTSDIKVELDQILIFSQKLLHKSGVNISNQPRLSVQLRYNDISQLKEQTTTFTPVHSKFVQDKQKELLKLWNKTK